MKWHAILIIAQKDILDAIKNLYILFALLMPIGLSLFLSVVFPDIEEPITLTIAVYDPGASRLTAILETAPYVNILKVSTEQELQETLKSAAGGLNIPSGFDAAVEAGQVPKLTVYRNLQTGILVRASLEEVIQQQVWTLVNPNMPARLQWIDVNASPGIANSSGFNFARFLLPMYLVITLVMTGAYIVPALLAEEKEKHTLDVLLLSPAGPVEVTLAKALVGLIYSFIISGILLLLNHGFAGNWPVTLLAVFLGALLIVGLGLLTGSLFSSIHQVNTWSSIVMLVLIIPSWAGVFGMKTILSKGLMLMPTYYLSDAISLALAGKGTTGQAWIDLGVLAGTALLVFGAVVWTLRRDRRSAISGQRSAHGR